MTKLMDLNVPSPGDTRRHVVGWTWHWGLSSGCQGGHPRVGRAGSAKPVLFFYRFSCLFEPIVQGTRCTPDLGPQGSTFSADFPPPGTVSSCPCSVGTGPAAAVSPSSAAAPAAFSPSSEDLHSDGLPYLFVLLKLLYPNTQEAGCRQWVVE